MSNHQPLNVNRKSNPSKRQNPPKKTFVIYILNILPSFVNHYCLFLDIVKFTRFKNTPRSKVVTLSMSQRPISKKNNPPSQ